MTRAENQRAWPCGACSPGGWSCELHPGHSGNHIGGDHYWQGTTRWRETQNRVFRAVIRADRAVRAADIIKITRLGRSTVYRHLRLLKEEGLLRNQAGRWYE